MSHPPNPLASIAVDPDALESFYRQHLPIVRGFVARRVADPELAADLTADIFLAAIDAAPGYDPGRGSPSGWLYGIARHAVATQRRGEARAQRALTRVAGRRPLQVDAITRAQERIDAERGARLLYEAMSALPAGQRAVLELVALDGLAVREAADVLGISPVTARVRLHRARTFLGAALTCETTTPFTSPTEVLT